MTKRWYTSKTIWFSILTIAAGIVAVVGEWVANSDFSPYGTTILLTGVIQVFLRFLTTQPIE